MLEDVLAVLASTPEKIRRELRGFSPRAMKTRPAPGKWSVGEILAHLDDVEEDGMRARVAAMLNQHVPRLRRFDQEARALERHYDRQDPARSFASFVRQRRFNVRWLRTLRPAQLKRKGMHEVVGEITAGEMIHEWAFHDLGHIQQILEIKRQALWPHLGNMRKFYSRGERVGARPGFGDAV